tara:strand:- start:437 stop:853 length:417 start_codon:yes stop_codon:yes gene_type:complete
MHDATSCILCAQGKSSAAGSPSCATCAAGKFWAVGDSEADAWTVCADKEGDTCTCTGTVKFGHDKPGHLAGWIEKKVFGSITCSRSEFGSDPVPGHGKKCLCNPSHTTCVDCHRPEPGRQVANFFLLLLFMLLWLSRV